MYKSTLEVHTCVVVQIVCYIMFQCMVAHKRAMYNSIPGKKICNYKHTSQSLSPSSSIAGTAKRRPGETPPWRKAACGLLLMMMMMM